MAPFLHRITRRDREFRISSISRITVFKKSNVLPNTFLKQSLTYTISLSQKPSYRGALAKLKSHLTFLLATNYCVASTIYGLPLSDNII